MCKSVTRRDGHASQSQRRIFCEMFNLTFGSPHTDTCKTCDSLKVKLDCAPIEEKAELTLRHEEHLKTAEDAYGSLQRESQLAQTHPMLYQVISFDMQQNLPTPHIHTSLVFYLRQLWVYNFGIHDCSTGTGFMCM